MRRLALSTLLMAALLAVSAAGPAAAKGQGKGLDERAEALVSAQLRSVELHGTHCRVRPTFSPSRLADVPVGPQVSAALGVFRRPATADERAAAEAWVGRRTPFGGVLPHDGVRLITASDGTVVTLTTFVDVPRPGLTRAAYDRCHKIVDRRLKARARQGNRVARRAVRLHAERTRTERPPATAPVTEVLFVGVGNGGGGGPFDPAEFADEGNATFSGPADARHGGSLHVALVVPDGVVSVRATFPAVSPRGAHRKPVHYPSAVTVEAPVTDNVAAFTAPRGVDDFGSATFTWLAADGSVMHTVGG